MYKRARRTKRDSVDNLYRHCALGADCPPDVRNKVENTTLADILLQIFGSVIYLGNLGIGSGKGSGGSTGYSTITPAPRPIPKPARPSRPFGVPLDPIGGGYGSEPIGRGVPTDVIDPLSSSIVPLSEDIGEPNIIITADPGTSLGGGDVVTSSTTILNPAFENEGLPAVFSRGDESTAILDVIPAEPPVKKIAIDFTTPNDTENIVTTLATVGSEFNVFVDPLGTGDTVGLEEIELGPLNELSQFDVEEPPSTSTPADTVRRVANRAKTYYNRFVEQLPTRNKDFLLQPSRAVQFEFENPAFTDEVSLQFQQDLDEVAAAPDDDFRDIRHLGIPHLSVTEGGKIRYSRLGTRGTITTRSGLTIGQKVHFYYDFSTITSGESIELQPIGEHSNINVFINPLEESTFIDSATANTGNIGIEYPDEDLVDTLVEDFSQAHLIISQEDETGDHFAIPSLSSNVPVRAFVPDITGTFTSDLNFKKTIIDSVYPFVPLEPSFAVDVFYDFYLHPELQRRKRRYSEIF